MDIEGEWLINEELINDEQPRRPTYLGRTADQWRADLSAPGLTMGEIREHMLFVKLAEGNGFHEFPALFDLGGNLVENASYVKIKTGPRAGTWTWRIGAGASAQWFHASRALSGTRRREADRARGYQLGLVRRAAQVRTRTDGRGSGYSFIAEVPGSPVEIIDNGSLGTQYQDRQGKS